MPLSWSTSVEVEHVRFDLHGSCSLAALQLGLSQIARETVATGRDRVLLNLMHVHTLLSHSELFKLGTHGAAAFADVRRVAVLQPAWPSGDLASMVASNRGVEAKVFLEESDALLWLAT